MRTAAARLALVLVLAGLAGLLPPACQGPTRVEPLRRVDRPPPVDEALPVARRHAPWILHATRDRRDLLAPVDFDGDLDGENDWEHLPTHELIPTVYYAALQTRTHWFLTYHLFHPRDWSPFELGVHTTHEGDGENLQVVVDKRRGAVVLLLTQAHYRGTAYAAPDGPIAAGASEPRGPIVLVDERGRPDPDGRHPVVFVEWGGHGIRGAADPCAAAALRPDGAVAFEGGGVVYRPARAGEALAEPDGPRARWRTGRAVPYRLGSTLVMLWPGVRDGSLVGEGRRFDGTVRYRDARVDVALPRFHEADRFSGPFGPDRGISPFALDYGWEEGTLGALFFDPAARHARRLTITPPWSLEYVDAPW